MAEFDAILKLSVGGGVFQLEDFKYAETPVVAAGRGRTGTKARMECTGWVSSADGTPSGLAANVATAIASFKLSRVDVVASEFGVTVTQILAARCFNKGPFVGFELQPNLDGTGGVKRFKVTVDADLMPDGPGGTPEPTNSYTIRVTTGPDGLRRVEIAGEVDGPAADDYYVAKVLPAFVKTYPRAGWGASNRRDTDEPGEKTTYTVTFAELVRPYPGDAENYGVQGEASVHTERDEQMRKVTRYVFDLLVVGDPDALLKILRTQVGAPATITREQSEVTRHASQRLRAEFDVLAGGDGTELLDWEQSFTRTSGGPTVDVARYPGLKPFLVRGTGDDAYRYVQRGRAVGLRRFPAAAERLDLPLLAPPSVVFSLKTQWECETTWEYQYASADGQTTIDLSRLSRPEKPSFVVRV